MKVPGIIRLPILFSLIIVIVMSCYYDNEEELYPADPNNPVICNTDSLTYSGEISAIINTKCASSGCHGGSQNPSLSDFASVSNRIQRIKVRALDDGTMPPASSTPLTDCEKLKLEAWINNGAPQN